MIIVAKLPVGARLGSATKVKAWSVERGTRAALLQGAIFIRRARTLHLARALPVGHPAREATERSSVVGEPLAPPGETVWIAPPTTENGQDQSLRRLQHGKNRLPVERQFALADAGDVA